MKWLLRTTNRRDSSLIRRYGPRGHGRIIAATLILAASACSATVLLLMPEPEPLPPPPPPVETGTEPAPPVDDVALLNDVGASLQPAPDVVPEGGGVLVLPGDPLSRSAADLPLVDLTLVAALPAAPPPGPASAPPMVPTVAGAGVGTGVLPVPPSLALLAVGVILASAATRRTDRPV